MGRKQKERQKKKNRAAAASSGEAVVGGNSSATTGRSSSNVIDVDVGVAAAKKGTIAKMTTKARCYHGTTVETFTNGSDFQMAIDTYLIVFKTGKNQIEMGKLLSAFYRKYQELMKNPEFNQGVFAVATDIFLKNSYGSEVYSSSKAELMTVLSLGILSKYNFCPLSADREKQNKYDRDCKTDRGIMNILERETKTFCNCMKPYKEDAKAMEKIGMCDNCHEEFPKMHLKRCSRCLALQYCSKECMRSNWPAHKQFCRPHNKN